MDRYSHPPNWPPVPPDWTPEEGWIPDPSWGPPPHNWAFWTPTDPWFKRWPFWGAAAAGVVGVVLAVVVTDAIAQSKHDPAYNDGVSYAHDLLTQLSDVTANNYRDLCTPLPPPAGTPEDPAADAQWKAGCLDEFVGYFGANN